MTAASRNPWHSGNEFPKTLNIITRDPKGLATGTSFPIEMEAIKKWEKR